MFETERVALRELVASDESLLEELNSDCDVMRYLTDGPPPSREDIQEAISRNITCSKVYKEKLGVWIASEKNSGHYMGWFFFKPTREEPENIHRVELGYRLKKAFWGKGFATEVCKALIQRGLEELEVEEVLATAHHQNLASQAVLKKCGLKPHREFFSDDFFGGREKIIEYTLHRG
jgi:RimJ/RimL family protein N-acetyltransferase